MTCNLLQIFRAVWKRKVTGGVPGDIGDSAAAATTPHQSATGVGEFVQLGASGLGELLTAKAEFDWEWYDADERRSSK